jgi:hypothetical protein
LTASAATGHPQPEGCCCYLVGDDVPDRSDRRLRQAASQTAVSIASMRRNAVLSQENDLLQVLLGCYMT